MHPEPFVLLLFLSLEAKSNICIKYGRIKYLGGMIEFQKPFEYIRVYDQIKHLLHKFVYTPVFKSLDLMMTSTRIYVLLPQDNI